MPCLLMISGPTRIVYLERSFDSPEEAREYADSLGKGSATQSDDSWPLDPLWKSKTLGDCPPQSASIILLEPEAFGTLLGSQFDPFGPL